MCSVRSLSLIHIFNIEKAMMNSEVGFGRRVLGVFEKYGINFEHMPSGIDTMTVFVHQSEFEDCLLYTSRRRH